MRNFLPMKYITETSHLTDKIIKELAFIDIAENMEENINNLLKKDLIKCIYYQERIGSKEVDTVLNHGEDFFEEYKK